MLDKLNQLSESHGEPRPGTGLVSGPRMAAQYGVVGDHVPNGFWKQLSFPFVWKSGG